MVATKPGRLLTAIIDRMKHYTGFSPGDRKALRKQLDIAATRGVKFIGPRGSNIDKGLPTLVSDLRPPYPVTVLEGFPFTETDLGAIVIARDVGDAVELNFISHAPDDVLASSPDLDEWMIAPLTCRIRYADAPVHAPYAMDVRFLLFDLAKDSVPDMETYSPFIRFYLGVCQILANHETTTEDIEPDAKEARSRRIRGKAPLFTYKTLVVGAPKARQVVRGGGTHASPRSHLRRGYYRTSKKGVRHWVKATMVKGETPGFVHKDYLVEQQDT